MNTLRLGAGWLARLTSMLPWRRLESRSRALCLLPWVQLHARANGAAMPCSIADERHPWPSLRHATVAEAFNSEPMRKLRSMMLSGQRSPVCRRCFAVEDAGGESLRQLFNRRFAERAAAAETGRQDGSADPSQIVSLDIRFSNLCNLRCRSCGPAASTAWYQDDPNRAPKDFWIQQAVGNSDELWAKIDPYLAGMQSFHFAGGEPMMMDETYQLLDKLIALGRTDVELTYITNATTWAHRDWDALDMWKRFEDVTVMASLDGSGPRGQYLRKGLDWDRAVENCLRLRRECPHVRFQIHYTVGAMNALHLPDFIDQCLSDGLIELDQLLVNPIQDPISMSLTSLPRGLKHKVRQAYQTRIADLPQHSPLASRLGQTIDYMDSRDTSDELPELRRATLALDEKRNESFSSTFPELAELMDSQ